MGLPYPTKVILPFDIATAQDMNERHANDVALAAGSGLDDDAIVTSKIDDGAVTADKIDFTTLAFGNFSTSEVDTGFKWIDSKNIYKKTINFGALPNTTSKSVAHGITGLLTVISISGASTNGGVWLPMPYVATSAANSVGLNADATNITADAGANRSSYTVCYITIHYTRS